MIEQRFLAFLEDERKRAEEIGTIRDRIAVERIYIHYMELFGARINPSTMDDYVDLILAREGMTKEVLRRGFSGMKEKRARIIRMIRDEAPGFFGQGAIAESIGMSQTVVSEALSSV